MKKNCFSTVALYRADVRKGVRLSGKPIYLPCGCNSSDTFAKVNAHNLADGATVVALTAFAVADRPEPIAAHLDHAAVGEILNEAKLEGFLKAIGVWELALADFS